MLRSLFLWLFPGRHAEVEAESRQWMMQCPHCGFEISVWDAGGMRYGGAGRPRVRRRCSNCGKIGMHLLYKRDGA